MTWAQEEVDCSENVLSSSFSIEAFESLIPVVYPNLVMIDLLVKYNATWYNVNLHDYTVSIDLSKVCDNDVSIDVSGIAQGVYLVEFSTGTEYFVYRVVKF